MGNAILPNRIHTTFQSYHALNEGKQVGLLYHWTSFVNAYMIIHENWIRTANRTVRDDARTINLADEYGVSFTRDKTFHGWKNRHYPMEVCFVIDGDKLSNNYKLFPYDDFFDGAGKPKKKEADEMETRTNRRIEKIKDYIVRVELYHNDSGATEKEQLDFVKWFAPYRNTLKGFNHQNYTSIEEYRTELCEWIRSEWIECRMM